MSDDDFKVYETAQIAFQRLRAGPGDLIQIKFPDDIHPVQMQKFAEGLQPQLPKGVTILCTRAGVTIDTLPKAEMNKIGWYNFNDGDVQEAEH